MSRFLASLMIAASLSMVATADIFDDNLAVCKGAPDPVLCGQKVLLAAMREFSKGAAGSDGGVPKCSCSCSSTGGAITCVLFYLDGDNSGTLANGLSPRDCVEAIRYPPCR